MRLPDGVRPWVPVALAAVFALASAERFMAYITLGPEIVYRLEWVVMAAGAFFCVCFAGLLFVLAREWVYG